MIAGLEQIQDLGTGEKQRYRVQATAQRLAENQAIRLHAVVLAGQQSARPSQPCLYLVADHQNAMAGTDLGTCGQITGRRHLDTTLALDRLHDECRCVVSDCGLQCVGIAVCDGAEPRWKWAEVALIPGFGRHRNGPERPAVEVAFARDDLGPPGRYTLDLVRPFPGGLQRCFHGLGAGVHGQGPIHARQFAGTLQEWSQPIREKGSGYHAEPSSLPVQCLHQARMRMTMADRGVGAHHVQITLAIDVPDIAALRPGQHDRQRLIVVRAVTRFQVDESAHGLRHNGNGSVERSELEVAKSCANACL